MAKKQYQGSILLEVLIIFLALLLIAVILIPNRIWKEEEALTKACRDNLNAIYEAERFYFKRTESYTDSLPKLVKFIQNDSSLQTRNKIVQLTRSLNEVIQSILDNPTIREVVTISQSLKEIRGDLRANERYFRKYEEILSQKEELDNDIARVDNSALFANFSFLKNYVDSLLALKKNISNYTLQNAALYAQKYVDSIQVYLPVVEKASFFEYWTQLESQIQQFINRIEKTDIVTVSSVNDRLRKFSGRTNGAVQRFMNTDLNTSMNRLQEAIKNVRAIHERYISPDMFSITQRRGLLQLGESDSILMNFNEKNFFCPDNQEPYLISIQNGHLTIECPNLLDEFQAQLQKDVEPIRSLAIYEYAQKIQDRLDSTYNVMYNTRVLFRREVDILLEIKQILAELKQITNVASFDYTRRLQQLVDTVQTEKRISVLKPMIEDILVPMDTLATRLETHNFQDLQKKLDYYAGAIQKLDSMIAKARLPRNIRRQVVEYYPVFASVMDVVNEMQNGATSDDAEKVRQAAKNLEKTLTRTLNGLKERVYVIFYKRHLNHGYIKDKLKSWEQE